MTIQDAINYFKGSFAIGKDDDSRHHNEVLEFTIKTLEQEPCEDAVSKAGVFEILGNLMSIPYDFDRPITEKDVSESMDEIRNLPSVTPTRKKGKWINKSQKSGCGITFVASECTCCGKKTLFNCDELIYKYCPNCGAKMKSEE